MEILIQRGISSKVMAWISVYFRNRMARTRFKGLSQLLQSENGMPQDGILSQALLNTLTSGIFIIHLQEEYKIISYEDDLAVITTGRHSLKRDQCCLDLVFEECRKTGVKISATKSLQPWNLMSKVQGVDAGLLVPLWIIFLSLWSLPSQYSKKVKTAENDARIILGAPRFSSSAWRQIFPRPQFFSRVIQAPRNTYQTKDR